MFVFLSFVVALASAAELTPIEAPDPIVVTVGKKAGNFHLIRAGSSLDFDTPGPKTVTVEVRQRLASTNQRAQGGLRALGNRNQEIMTISVKSGAERDGRIMDSYGGVPSKIDSATIEVPPHGSILTLEAKAGGPDYLVRVTDNTPDAPAAVAAAPVDDAPKEEPRPVEDKTPEKKNDRTGSGAAPAVGAAFGLGVPARGTKAVGYLAVEGRYPVFKNILSAGGAIGWYRIGVNQSVAVADPYAGPSEIDGVWHTDVVPIVARLIGHLPYDLGPVIPMAGAGFGIFFAKRIDGEFKSTRLGVGPELLLGSEFDIDVAGRIGVNVSWNGARVRYGNRDPDGEEVRETIANTRLNLHYLYLF